jgi:hydrogenase maturation protease
VSTGKLNILIYGYGNPSRQDDGLGNALVEKFEQAHLSGLFFDSNYQLNIEDADNIKDFDVVIFVDATLKTEEAPFNFYKVVPSKEITFTTHSMAPESVISLCEEISEKVPDAYIMAIPGYEWELLVEGLTDKAVENLNKAYEFLLPLVKNPDLIKFKEATDNNINKSRIFPHPVKNI